jgi:PTS system mannitol-specific IIA component
MNIMDKALLSEKTIRVNASYASKEEAIRACGELLLSAGLIERPYIDAMIARDELSTTYVGNGVAVPHGTEASKPHIKKTGLAIVQVPAGVDFGKGRIARLLIAVAALGNEHIDLLTEIAQICVDDDALGRLLSAKTPKDLLATIAGEGK